MIVLTIIQKISQFPQHPCALALFGQYAIAPLRRCANPAFLAAAPPRLCTIAPILHFLPLRRRAFAPLRQSFISCRCAAAPLHRCANPFFHHNFQNESPYNSFFDFYKLSLS
jgi:hypothetical protein